MIILVITTEIDRQNTRCTCEGYMMNVHSGHARWFVLPANWCQVHELLCRVSLRLTSSSLERTSTVCLAFLAITRSCDWLIMLSPSQLSPVHDPFSISEIAGQCHITSYHRMISSHPIRLGVNILWLLCSRWYFASFSLTVMICCSQPIRPVLPHLWRILVQSDRLCGELSFSLLLFYV